MDVVALKTLTSSRNMKCMTARCMTKGAALDGTNTPGRIQEKWVVLAQYLTLKSVLLEYQISRCATLWRFKISKSKVKL